MACEVCKKIYKFRVHREQRGPQARVPRCSVDEAATTVKDNAPEEPRAARRTLPFMKNSCAKRARPAHFVFDSFRASFFS